MNFEFSKDQKLIQKSAREFFAKECPKDKVRELKEDPLGYDPKIWKKMVDLGFTGMVIPEAFGGTEGSFLDLTILMEEIGRNIVPSPFFATVALCAMPILEYGTGEQKKTFLPAIAEKGQIWTLALNEKAADYQADDIQLTAKAEGDGYVLNGVKLFVPYANAADRMLVAARTKAGNDPQTGITFFMVERSAPGVHVDVIPTTARDMRCEVRFNDVRVGRDRILGTVDQGWTIADSIIRHAAVLKSAEMSGGAQAVLDIAVRYARERIQFDKPIGSFQAIQHRLVNLLIEVDGLKYLVYEAAWKINAGNPDPLLISLAKAKANHVYHRVCHDGMVIHGAIGWTEEMDIGLYHIRTRSNESEAGGMEFHLERAACELERMTPAFREMWPNG